MTQDTKPHPINFLKKTRPIGGGATEDVPEARASNIKLRCGDCMHWKGTAHPSIGKPCFENGVTARATAPSCYTANLNVFRDQTPESLEMLAALTVGMTHQQQRVYMGLLRTASSLERANLSFGQTVYFATGKGETLSDYYRGFACSRGPGGTILVVGTQYLKGNRAACTAMLERESLLTRKQFVKIKQRLIAQGALVPLPARRQALVAKSTYEPPTLDTAAEFLEAQASKMKKTYGGQVRHDQEKTWVIDQTKSDAGDDL